MMASALDTLHRPPEARRLAESDRRAALGRLRSEARRNLLLIDLVARVGAPAAGPQGVVEALGVWRGDELSGVVCLRPSLAVEATLDLEVLDAFAPYLASVEAGLLKGAERVVSPLWRRLETRGRRALLDREEIALALDPGDHVRLEAPREATCRRAEPGDLDALVAAARASLLEEDRPDPFPGDPAGFRSWVYGRLGRARVVQADEDLAFVAYADVQRSEGWLVQGVYTFPEARRRGYAAAGVSALAEEAFATGADHVQLAVVDGNGTATRLYERLGYRPFDTLRTVLFV